MKAVKKVKVDKKIIGDFHGLFKQQKVLIFRKCLHNVIFCIHSKLFFSYCGKAEQAVQWLGKLAAEPKVLCSNPG